MMKFLDIAKRLIALRDAFFIIGLLSLFYGLFLFIPWVSFSVCGVILMLVGWLLEDDKQ